MALWKKSNELKGHLAWKLAVGLVEHQWGLDSQDQDARVLLTRGENQVCETYADFKWKRWFSNQRWRRTCEYHRFSTRESKFECHTIWKNRKKTSKGPETAPFKVSQPPIFIISNRYITLIGSYKRWATRIFLTQMKSMRSKSFTIALKASWQTQLIRLTRSTRPNLKRNSWQMTLSKTSSSKCRIKMFLVTSMKS